MPILSKAGHRAMMQMLEKRYFALAGTLEARELTSASEGCRRGCWRNADAVCATVGSAMDIRLAVTDFKTALKEVEGLK